jgi:hypothetical protein
VSTLTVGIAIGTALSVAAGTGLVPWSVANGIFACLRLPWAATWPSDWSRGGLINDDGRFHVKDRTLGSGYSPRIMHGVFVPHFEMAFVHGVQVHPTAVRA